MDQDDQDLGDEPSNVEPIVPIVYVTERMVAERTGTSMRMWQALRQNGGGPSFVRLSNRCVRYRWSEVEQWLAERTRTHT